MSEHPSGKRGFMQARSWITKHMIDHHENKSECTKVETKMEDKEIKDDVTQTEVHSQNQPGHGIMHHDHTIGRFELNTESNPFDENPSESHNQDQTVSNEAVTQSDYLAQTLNVIKEDYHLEENDETKRSPDEIEMMPLQERHQLPISPSRMKIVIIEGSMEELNDVEDRGTFIRSASRTNQQEKKEEPQSLHIRESYQVLLSALYCKILVICGAALAIEENITKKLPRSIYHIFYVYLFLGSLLFLLYIYMDLIRYKLSKIIKNKNVWIGSFKDNFKPGELRKATSISTMKSIRSVLEDVNQRPKNVYGSFYLRIGALLFGTGSLIYSGIEIGQMIEAHLNEDKQNCRSEIRAVQPFFHITFVFVQMYFIFLNLKMSIYKHRCLCRFGMMHMIATNLCVWLSVLIYETSHEIKHHSEGHHAKDPHVTNAHDIHNVYFNSEADAVLEPQSAHLVDPEENNGKCNFEHFVMNKLLNKAAPFLFPCTIEYSLICAAVLYTMWKHINEEHEWYYFSRFHSRKNPRRNVPNETTVGDSEIEVSRQVPKRQYTSVSSIDEESEEIVSGNRDGRHGVKLNVRQRHHYSLDCSKASNGLFCGIFVMVVTVIAIIVFFVLEDTQDEQSVATITALSEIILYSISLFAVILGIVKVRALRYDSSPKMELDTLLLIIGQAGVLIFATFSILSSFSSWDKYKLATFSPPIYLIQTLVQTLFLLDASNRSPKSESQEKSKPGREIVTFLMLSNLSMWAFNALISNRSDSHSMQREFFGGGYVWPIITHVSMPLAIFYRFHSTVCLCEIWSKTFKMKENT